jgi:hypothetical protein
MLSVALSLAPEEAAGRYPAPSFRGARTFLAGVNSAAVARPSGQRYIDDHFRIFEMAYRLAYSWDMRYKCSVIIAGVRGWV